jgi:hypothetical protein
MLVRKLLASTTLAVGLVGAGGAGVSTVIGSTATAGAPSPCPEWRYCRPVPVETIRNPIPEPELIAIGSPIELVTPLYLQALTVGP